MKYYKQVIIKNDADLPKENGEYFCNRSGFRTVQKLGGNLLDKSYQREIRWYLVEADLKEELTRVKESAINNQHGLNFPNELYIEATAIIMVCDHFLEYLTNKEKP